MAAQNPLLDMLTTLMMQKQLSNRGLGAPQGRFGANPAASIPRPPMEPGGGLQTRPYTPRPMPLPPPMRPAPSMPVMHNPRPPITSNPPAPMMPQAQSAPNFAGLAAQLLAGRGISSGGVKRPSIPRLPVM